MDVRKKLVELLTDNLPRIGNLPKCDNPLQYTIDEIVERIADHLIMNDVTVQKHGYWASLTDCANAGVYCSVCHKKVYKEDYARCNRKNKLRSDYCPHCGAKMMPQQPAEEG